MENISININNYISLSLEKNKVKILILNEKFKEYNITKLKDFIKTSKLKDDINIYIKYSKYTNQGIPSFNDFVLIAKHFIYWESNSYNINILDYRLSLPLLRKLVQVEDRKAKKVFYKQLLILLWTGDHLVLKYLIKERYDDYIRLESYKRRIHYPKSIYEIKLTVLLCIFNIIIYLLFKNLQLTKYFELNRSKILENFEIWRVFTSIFSNSESLEYPGNIFIFTNTWFLFVVGSFFESNNIFSRKVYLAIYWVSGLVGNLAFVFSPVYDFNTAAGSSGCTFGLMGAFIIILIGKRRYFWTIIMIIISGLFIYESLLPGIVFIAHVFGFLPGIIINSIIYKYNSHQKKNKFAVKNIP